MGHILSSKLEVKMRTIESQCQAAREAFDDTPVLSTSTKNRILLEIADALVVHTSYILIENLKDVNRGREAGLDSAMLDRLTLTADRIQGMADGVRAVASLDDPVGEELAAWTVEHSGLSVQKIRVPIGVIGMIYEARPNVTIDAASLCFKTGNAVVLRGSSSAFESNSALVEIMHDVMQRHDVTRDLIQLLDDTSREGVDTFVRLNQFLHLMIPRGGASLIQHVVQTATVPTIETGAGNCHIFVDREANLDRAIPIIVNAKVQRPSVCNALETVIIHQQISREFLPRLVEALAPYSVILKGDDAARTIIPSILPATEEDWAHEFLGLTLAVKLVSSLGEAEAHIRQYGTKHTEVIVTEDARRANHFVKTVDAAAVGVNVSTRFTDGGEFGFGAEIGISTQMLHARGPMGLPELTSYKYVMTGDYLVRK